MVGRLFQDVIIDYIDISDYNVLIERMELASWQASPSEI